MLPNLHHLQPASQPANQLVHIIDYQLLLKPVTPGEMVRLLPLLGLILFLNIAPIENVDRNNFKTCEQSAFCR